MALRIKIEGHTYYKLDRADSATPEQEAANLVLDIVAQRGGITRLFRSADAVSAAFGSVGHNTFRAPAEAVRRVLARWHSDNPRILN